jgi:transcriptional regulator with XRE-family HTH domain
MVVVEPAGGVVGVRDRGSLMPAEVSAVGRNVLRLLRQRGRSLSWLAKRTDVSVSQLSLMTRGKTRQPLASTLEAIARGLAVPVGELLREGDDPPIIEGVIAIPVVVFREGIGGVPESQRTGATVIVDAARHAGRENLAAVQITGGGPSPHVLAGDVVILDPEVVPIDGELVLVTRRGTTFAGWFVLGDPPQYELADGLFFSPDEVIYRGIILGITREPPTRRAR